MDMETHNFRITSDDDAIGFLEKILHHNIGSNISLEVTNWPKLSIKYHGEDFDGTVTAAVAKTIIELQNTFNSIYCLCVYDDTNTRRLKAEERQALQIKVQVKEGCTELDLVEISKLFLEQIGKMSDPYQAAVYIFAILACCSAVGFIFWLKHKDKDNEREKQLEMEKEKTEQLRVFSDFASKFSQCKPALSTADQLNENIIRTAGEASSIEANGITIGKDRIRALQQKRRNTSNRKRLEGDFRVDKADSSNEKYWEFQLVRADGKLTCTAKTDNEKSIDDLYKALKSKNFVHLNIDATMLNGELKDAWVYPGDELTLDPD